MYLQQQQPTQVLNASDETLDLIARQLINNYSQGDYLTFKQSVTAAMKALAPDDQPTLAAKLLSRGADPIVVDSALREASWVPAPRSAPSQPDDELSWWGERSTFQKIYAVLGLVGTGVGAYHGYRRNNGSVGWAIGWALLGGIFPVIMLPVAFAQGVGKPKRPRLGSVGGEERFFDDEIEDDDEPSAWEQQTAKSRAPMCRKEYDKAADKLVRFRRDPKFNCQDALALQRAVVAAWEGKCKNARRLTAKARCK